MIITRTSVFSGKQNSMDIPVTESEISSWLSGGKLIQDAFPNLNSDQREFLLTGTTPEEWNETFGAS